MPRGPKGEKRPADVIGAACRYEDRDGDIEDVSPDDGKDPERKLRVPWCAQRTARAIPTRRM
jgi:hypothetical protein